MYQWTSYTAANEADLVVLLNRLEVAEEMPDYVYAPTPERNTWLVLARKITNRRPAAGAARNNEANEAQAEDVVD